MISVSSLIDFLLVALRVFLIKRRSQGFGFFLQKEQMSLFYDFNCRLMVFMTSNITFSKKVNDFFSSTIFAYLLSSLISLRYHVLAGKKRAF